LDYENMSKEELIAYLIDVERKRAFSYEDQIKLAAIDSSPFTLWASNRDCIIRIWEGKCESLYGYSREYAIGKDFVDLFVAEHEKDQAREDQIAIIDHDEIFHNIANDFGKSGNTLQLLTNCWRFVDPATGEVWNMEMGLIVDYFDQERERLNQVIEESRILKSRVTEFLKLVGQYEQQFRDRRRSIESTIRGFDITKIAKSKRDEYLSEKKAIFDGNKIIETRLQETKDKYISEVSVCGSADKCTKLSNEFEDAYDDILSELEEVSSDFQDMIDNYSNKNEVNDTNIVRKDLVIEDVHALYKERSSRAFELRTKIQDSINEYKRAMGEKATNTSYLGELNTSYSTIDVVINKIDLIKDDATKKIQQAVSLDEINAISSEMHASYEEIDTQLGDLAGRYK